MDSRALLVVTGLPGSGKSTLARALAAHFGRTLLAKDDFKEVLFDALVPPGDARRSNGSHDVESSRRLSDASFAAMFRLLERWSGSAPLLEGNFRRGEHEAAIEPYAARGWRIVQILCVVTEPVRLARLEARASDPTRHAVHGDALGFAAAAIGGAGGEFLDLPGARIRYDASGSDRAFAALLRELYAVAGSVPIA